MPITYLKKATRTAETGQADVRAAVEAMLAEIDRDGEKAVQRFARDFDKWEGGIIVTPEERARAAASMPKRLKNDIRFAHDNIRRFAEAQKATISDCTVEIIPGLMAGQRQIPVKAAGCYVPGGRYSHIASAIMTITTAKVAGVPHIAACSPPRPGTGIPAAMIFTMDLCGADVILNLGGVMSPDGSTIALTLSKDGNSEIYTIDTSGGIKARLTNNAAIDGSPTWNPGGNQIAFVSSRNGGPQVFRMGSNGSGATRLSKQGNYNQTPDWNPGQGARGSMVAYAGRDNSNRYDIFAVDAGRRTSALRVSLGGAIGRAGLRRGLAALERRLERAGE